MDNQSEQFAILIEKLSRQKPVLDDAGALTDHILAEIAARPHKQALPSFIFWIRLVSSSAAVFLLGLFLFQQTGFEQIPPEASTAGLLKKETKRDIPCFQSVDEKEPDRRTAYFCYVKQNLQKENSLRNFIKQYIHENLD